MEMLETPPFYIGQDVVANQDTLFFRKGYEFKVINIMKGCCNWVVDVGIQNYGRFALSQCKFCGGQTELNPNGTICLYYYVFSPKESSFSFISMKELAERQLEIIGVN